MGLPGLEPGTSSLSVLIGPSAAASGTSGGSGKRLRSGQNPRPKTCRVSGASGGPGGVAVRLQYIKAEYERDEFIVGGRLLRHTPQYNELGWPALAVPTADGLVQVAGRPGSERPRCLPSAGDWGCRARTSWSLADPRVSGPRVLLLQ